MKNDDDQPLNKTLTLLKEFPANRIYGLGDKHAISLGYQLYSNKHISSFEWSEDASVLTAEVDDSSLFMVDFFLTEKGLEFQCDCDSWDSPAKCAHIICSLFTIKNLLSPQLFTTNTKTKMSKKKHLLSSLLNKQNRKQKRAVSTEGPKEVKPERYSIVITAIEGSLSYDIQRKKKTVTQLYNDTPTELIQLMDSATYYGQSSDILFEYLTTYGNRYPLFLKIQKTEIPLEWHHPHEYQSIIELNACGDMIIIKRLCSKKKDAPGGPFCDQIVLVGNLFAVDLDSKKLFALQERNSWYFWNWFHKEIYAEGLHSSRITADSDNKNDLSNRLNVPLETFRAAQFVCKASERKNILALTVLKVDDQNSDIIEGRVEEYMLTAEPDEIREDTFMLKAGYTYEKQNFLPDKSCFHVFIDLLYNSYSFLRSKKRRTIIYQTILLLTTAQSKKEAKKIITTALLDREIFQRSAMRYEVKNMLEQFYKTCSPAKEFFSYSVQKKKWHIVSVDTERQAQLYAIPFALFGPDIFSAMNEHHSMPVSGNKLHDNLSLLYQQCNNHSIALFFKNKPVVAVRWDFSFDCSQGSGINWFEVKPEIRCGTTIVDAKSWQEALNKKSVLIKKDCIKVIDSKTEEILQTLSSMLLLDKKPGKKEIRQVPRLQILDWIALRNKGVIITLPPKEEKIIERLLSLKSIRKRRLPEKMHATLRPYQAEGYYWLSFLYENRFGACLADDMGLGKTVQAISLLGAVKERIVTPAVKKIKAPHLIVLPPSLLHNWDSEINKFYPDLQVGFYVGNKRDARIFEESDCILTTYGVVRKDITLLKEKEFNIIIFDEAQTVKNIHADTTSAARQLRGYFKLATTGTPLENHLGEYYSIIDLCLPGLLGEYGAFKKQMKKDHAPLLDLLIRKTKPFVLRRTKAQVLDDLPPKTETDIYLHLTPKQKTLYTNTVAMIRSTIDEAYDKKTSAQAKIIALTALLKLRQLCISPRLVDPSLHDTSPKIQFLIEKLKELLEEGHSGLVFSQFTSFLDILEHDLIAQGIDFVRLDGSTPIPKRKKLVETFQEGKGPSIFLLSLKAGGQGLNLTRASYVFHLDPWWNPAVENQASDRAHRIGQDNKVTITRILMYHTIEEKMMELKKKKLSLYKAVLDGSTVNKKGFSISKKDFEFLLEP